jgi:hypothetical protein
VLLLLWIELQEDRATDTSSEQSATDTDLYRHYWHWPSCVTKRFPELCLVAVLICELGSSVSIVSSYGLDDQAFEVRSPAGAKDFSSTLCVQTGSEAHPASCTMGTGGPFPGTKARPGRDADHSPTSSSEVENE